MIEDVLRDLIVEKFGSVVAFARHLGVPNSTIASILQRGVRNASVTNVVRICNALGISADELAEGRITPKSKTECVDIAVWLGQMRSHLMTTAISLDGVELTEEERMALYDSLNLSVEFIRRRRK